jgi:dihydrofolate reductase
MPRVIADITMSLDGYVSGPGADEQHGLGDAPELHAWVTEQDAVDTEILQGATAQSGAVVMGRRLFDIVDGPDGWSIDMGYGADQAATHGHVVIMGGGDVIGQALEQGLVDELRIHLAPMLLGGGTPLFKPGTRQMYRQRDIRPSKNAVHLAYERA